jgi:hypothetical protein
VTVGFRPESVEFVDGGDLVGQVVSASFAGEAVEYQIDLGDKLVRVKTEPYHLREPGDQVVLRVPAERCYLLEGS